MPGGPVTFDKGSGPITKPAGVRQALPAIGVAAFAAFGGILFGELSVRAETTTHRTTR